MTTVRGLDRAPRHLHYTTVELVSCLTTAPARAYGSKSRLAARRQPTDQYDGALDTTGGHIGAAQWHWPTSPGTSNQRSGRRGRGFESRHPDSVMSQDIRIAVNLRLGSQLFLWAATSVGWTAPHHQSITGFGNQLAIQLRHLSRHGAIASDFGVDSSRF